MADKRDTDLHKPDGVVFRGDKLGHADRESHIRRRDGLIFKGDELGYVDREKQIRKPDGIIFKGEVVGQVKGTAAHAARTRSTPASRPIRSLLSSFRSTPATPVLSACRPAVLQCGHGLRC